MRLARAGPSGTNLKRDVFVVVEVLGEARVRRVDATRRADASRMGVQRVERKMGWTADSREAVLTLESITPPLPKLGALQLLKRDGIL